MCIYVCISCKCMCIYKYAMKVSTVLTSVISGVSVSSVFGGGWESSRLG